jgi:hypothetical protein
VPVIAPEKLQELRDARPAEYGKMSITAIGRHVGAAQIVYVQLLSSDVTPIVGGEGFIGEASANVKVVHVETGHTLWPTDQTDGYAIAVSSKSPQSRAPTAADVRRDLNAKLTDEISRLFRKWKPDDMAPESLNL